MRSRIGRIPVKRKMRELVAMLHKRYTLRELGKIAGVCYRVLYNVENGNQVWVSQENSEKIMELSNIVTVEDMWKADSEKKARGEG